MGSLRILLEYPLEWILQHKVLALSIAGCTAGYITGSRALKNYKEKIRLQKLREKWNNVGKDVVVLHQYRRGKFCINMSPFAMKVETFLRLNNIKYEVDFEVPYGRMHKCPWITLNGKDIVDSEFIFDHLRHEFCKDLDKELDEQTKTILEAVRITADEYLFWCVVTWRYAKDKFVTFMPTQSLPPSAAAYMLWRGPKLMAIKCDTHGMGRYEDEEVYQICRKTCGTLSSFLGEKPFFSGDEPLTADCSLFGQLAQLMWNAPGSRYEALITEVFPNLGKYCLRMKESVYPDWNQLLNPPQPYVDKSRTGA